MSTHEGSDGDRAGNHVVSFISFPELSDAYRWWSCILSACSARGVLGEEFPWPTAEVRAAVSDAESDIARLNHLIVSGPA